MGIRSTLLWIWKLFDPLFYLFSRLHYIGDVNNKPSVFRVRLTKYKGKKYILSDGTKIDKNDLLLKIHLHNVRIITEIGKIKNDLKRAKLTYRLVLHSMPALASYLKEHPDEKKIIGIIGITSLDRGVKALGFECFRPKSRIYRFFKKLGQLPIYFLSNSSLRNFQKNHLTYLFLSKETLYSRYVQDSSEK